MTAIVGVLCKDGIVIGTDSSATFGQGPQFRTIEQPTEKCHIIGEHIIVAGTGEVGLDQRFCKIVKEAWENKQFKGSEIDVAKRLAKQAIEDFQSTYAQSGSYGALIAFPVNHKPFLCEYALTNFQPELKTGHLWYCSIGSSQAITDPFLALMREIFWREGPPDLNEGIFAVTWALDHAIAVNPGGVNGPIRIAVLERVQKTDLKARLLEETELAEHRQYIREAKQCVRDYRSVPKTENAGEIPDIPRK
jgi:20S proteasome alpha/beta subunit